VFPNLDEGRGKVEIVSFQVHTATSMKVGVFWDVMPCSLEHSRRFSGSYCLRRPDNDDGFYKTTRRSIPEDNHIEVNVVHVMKHRSVEE
jgi:hypothetical protein